MALEFGLPHLQDGATPLHYAVQVGALQTVKLLIKYRVDVNVADVVSWKGTLLLPAQPFWDIKLFLHIFLVMQDGWTPLHLAVQSRNRDITKILLVNGADQARRTNVWPFWFNVFGSMIFASYVLRSYFVYIFMPLYVASQNFDSRLEKCSYPLYNFLNLDVLSRPYSCDAYLALYSELISYCLNYMGWCVMLPEDQKMMPELWTHKLFGFMCTHYRVGRLHWTWAYVSEGISTHMIWQSFSNLFQPTEGCEVLFWQKFETKIKC